MAKLRLGSKTPGDRSPAFDTTTGEWSGMNGVDPEIPARSPVEGHPREELRAALEAAGLKYTRQREAVYERLRDATHHPTAEEVYLGVKPAIPSISLATVYKSLEALTECGLATKLSDPQGSARYDARPDHHYHLRCLRSGQVEDLPTSYDPALIDKLDPELARTLSERGFHLTGYRLELVGYYDGAPSPAPERDAE